MLNSHSSGDDSPTLLKHRVRHGAVSSAAGQIGSQVVSIASLAVLLRLVGTEDYGLVGMVLPVVLFLRIFTTFGLQVATVQRPSLSDDVLSALFWSTLFGGLAMAALACIFAPFMSRLYARPDLHAQLTPLTLALGGTLLMWALGAQHVAILERRMHFGRLAPIRLAAQVAGAVAAISAAFAGWGVWALIVQQYVELGLLACLVWLAAGWRPRLPRLMFWHMDSKASPEEGGGESGIDSKDPGLFGESLRFGGYFAAASVVLFAADHFDRILLGRFAGPDAVGLYSQAKNLMIKPVYLVTTPLSALVLSGLARAADHPSNRSELVEAFYRILAIVLLPICIGSALVGNDVMPLLGGAEWTDSGKLLSALSVGIFAQALLIINGWMLAAVGKTGSLLVSAVVVFVVLALGYFIGCRIGARYGNPPLGVAWGYSASVLGILVVPHTLFVFRAAGLRGKSLARRIGRPLLASLGMGPVVWAVGQWFDRTVGHPPAAKLLAEVVAGVIVYTLLAKGELRWLWAQWRQVQGEK